MTPQKNINNKIDISDYFSIPKKSIEITKTCISDSINPFESNPLYRKIKDFLLEDGFSFGDFGLVHESTSKEISHNYDMAKEKLKNKNIFDEIQIQNSTKGFCGEWITIKLFKCISEALGINTDEFRKIIPPISVLKNDAGQDIKVGKTTYSIKSRRDTNWARGTRSENDSDIFKIGVYTVFWTFVNNDCTKYKLEKTGNESNEIFRNFDGIKHLSEHFIKYMTEAVERLRNENTQT
jgi:hypothetical protein